MSCTAQGALGAGGALGHVFKAAAEMADDHARIV
jgi:hypothetical protein